MKIEGQMCTLNFNECGFNGLLGGHWECMGGNSGEGYFEKFFNKFFKEAIEKNYKIYFSVKDVYGCPPSFIVTLIELTIETYGIEEVQKRILGFIDGGNKDYRNFQIKDTIEFYKNKPKGYKHPDNLKYCQRYKTKE